MGIGLLGGWAHVDPNLLFVLVIQHVRVRCGLLLAQSLAHRRDGSAVVHILYHTLPMAYNLDG